MTKRIPHLVASTVLLALLAAVPPLVTVPLEMWFRRIGLLSERPR